MKTAYLTFADLGTVLKKHLLPILVALLVCFGAGAAVRLAIPATYSTDATYYVRNMQGEEFIKKNGLTTSQLASVQTLCKEYATLIETCDGLYDRVLEKLSSLYPQMTREELRGMVSATSDNTLIRVTVTHTDRTVADTVAFYLQSEVAPFVNETAWPHLSAEMQCVTLASTAPPATRSSAHPLVIGALTGVFGAFLTYLFFLLRFLCGNTLRDTDEITRVLPELPLLGELQPNLSLDEEAFLQAKGLHTLRTNVTVRLKGTQCPIVGIVGVGIDGYLAESLAVSFSGAEKRVLVMDLNDAHQGQPELPAGLFDYLEGREASLDALLHQTETEGVMRLCSGFAHNAKPQDLLATARFRTLLQSLAGVMDVILLAFDNADTAAILSSEITGCVLTVGAGVSGARQLRQAFATLQNAEASVLGLAAWL